MNTFAPRTFGSTFYATLCGFHEPAREWSDTDRRSVVNRANDLLARHGNWRMNDALDAAWADDYHSAFLFGTARRWDEGVTHELVASVLDYLYTGCGGTEPVYSSWRKEDSTPWSDEAMFRQDCNYGLEVTWRGWKQAVAAARSGIAAFDLDAPNPIDRFSALLAGLAPEATVYPKHTVALLLEEWVRVHNSLPIARIGDRLRVTRPWNDFVTGQTVQCVNVGASVIYVVPVNEHDGIAERDAHVPMDRDTPAWEHLNGAVVETFEPEGETVDGGPDWKALYEQAQREHTADIELIERKFWQEAIARSWCSEAEQVMNWLNDNGLHMQFEVDRDKHRPTNRYTLKGYASVTITDTRGETWVCENHDFEVTGSGTSESDALDRASEWCVESDVRSAVEVLTAIPWRWVNVSSFEFRRAELLEAESDED